MPTFTSSPARVGFFEHDDLAWHIVAREAARRPTSPRRPRRSCTAWTAAKPQEVVLEADAGAFLEYLPDPLILFPRRALRSRLRCGCIRRPWSWRWDAIVPHDPQRAASGTFDWIASELRVEAPDGSLLARDRYRLSRDMLSRCLPGVTGPFTCQGAFVVVQRHDRRSARCRRRCALPYPRRRRSYAGGIEPPRRMRRSGCACWRRMPSCVARRAAAGMVFCTQSSSSAPQPAAAPQIGAARNPSMESPWTVTPPTSSSAST